MWLTRQEIIEIHALQIETFGGSIGIRDETRLLAACERPRNGYYDNVWQQAAVYLQAFTRDHPFVDGNKRIGFAACAVPSLPTCLRQAPPKD